MRSISVCGVEFASIAAACKHFGIPKHHYDNRKKAGWTVRQIFGIDPPPVRKPPPGTRIKVDGLEFPSISQACRHFGAVERQYRSRKAAGLTDRQCLGLDPLPSEEKSKAVEKAERLKKRPGMNVGFDADGKQLSRSIVAGQKFGRWTALEDVENVTTRTKVRCRCECGNEGRPNFQTLSNGAAGCQFCCRSLSRGKRARPQKDLVGPGDVFGRWTATGKPYKAHNRKFYVDCRCECGTERAVMVQGLLSGASKSCGCLNREVRSNSQRLFRAAVWTACRQGVSPPRDTPERQAGRCLLPVRLRLRRDFRGEGHAPFGQQGRP